jgi:hypothetical protein
VLTLLLARPDAVSRNADDLIPELGFYTLGIGFLLGVATDLVVAFGGA